MAGRKCFFWKGIRVLGSLITWKPVGLPQSPIEKQGTARELGELGVRSRNYLYDIPVSTSVSPQEVLDLGNDLTLGPQGVKQLVFLQFQKSCIQISRTLGPLSWCEDDDQRLDISAVITLPVSYPGQVNLMVSGAGFTPVVGMYVLVREKTSGEGFVGPVMAYAAPSLTVGDCPFEITIDYEVFLIRFSFPDTAFISTDPGDLESQIDDKWIPMLKTIFKSKAHPVYPNAYVIEPE